MAAPERAMWFLLLSGSILLCVDLARMRFDPLATAVAGGLVVLACLSVGTISATTGW
jgi:hypothetical protein